MENYKRHYEAIVKRGLITDKTTKYDFLKKIREEFFEFNKEMYKDAFETGNLRHDTIQEGMDLIYSIENFFTHFDVDIDKEREINIQHQLTRKD